MNDAVETRRRVVTKRDPPCSCGAGPATVRIVGGLLVCEGCAEAVQAQFRAGAAADVRRAEGVVR
jgi:hypothetical protein